jgi:hypothetical protein
MEGAKAHDPRAIDFAHDDVVTCGLEDPLPEVRPRVDASPYRFAFVTTADGVILGRLRRKAIEEGDGAAGEAMEPGPSTARPDLSPAKLRERLERKGFRTAVLSDPEGRLLGIVLCEELSRA